MDIIHIAVVVCHAIQTAHIAVKRRHGKILEPVRRHISNRQPVVKTIHDGVSHTQPVFIFYQLPIAVLYKIVVAFGEAMVYVQLCAVLHPSAVRFHPPRHLFGGAVRPSALDARYAVGVHLRHDHVIDRLNQYPVHDPVWPVRHIVNVPQLAVARLIVLGVYRFAGRPAAVDDPVLHLVDARLNVRQGGQRGRVMHPLFRMIYHTPPYKFPVRHDWQ